MIAITECPLRYIGQEISQVLQLADLYEKGLPPVSGGALDQSQWFLNAVEAIRSARDECAAQRAERAGG